FGWYFADCSFGRFALRRFSSTSLGVGTRMGLFSDRFFVATIRTPENPICTMRMGRSHKLLLRGRPLPTSAPTFIGLHRLAELCSSPSSTRSEEHTSELQSRFALVCRLPLE